LPDEAGFDAGQAYVTVSPDTEGFAEKLRAAIEEAVDGIDAKVKIGADDSEFQAKADDVRAKTDELDGTEAKVTLTADDEDLQEKADSAKAKLDELDGTESKATLTADDEDLNEKLDSAKERLEENDSTVSTPKLDLDKSGFDEKKDSADERLKENDETTATPKLDLDKGDFDAKKDDADARLDANDARKASPKLGLDDEEFKDKLAEDDASLSSSGGGGFEMPGGMLTYLAGGLTSILPGIAGASTGLGELAGTGYLAFDGIAKALEAHKEASTNVGQTTAELASTEFQNSVQIQQAQQAIGQAHRQAAEDATTSAEAIESAEANLTETERNASASQVQAVQAVGQAQQQLQQANFGLASAQYNLSMAWIQAKYDLEQLNDAQRDQATTLAAAHLAVQEAQYQQTLTDQNAYSTNLNKEQAAIAVAQAQEQLTSAQQSATETAAEAHLEDAKGVAGSQQVVQAQEAVTEAVDAQKDAQQQLADAQTSLRDTELNNAAQIKAAQLAVTQAQQQAAYQQESDALAVAQAQQNLTSTLKEQKLQQAATASTANSAANQFAKDMARLSPAGRQMVDVILSISKAFGPLEMIAQNGVAPGMLQFFKGIRDQIPDITFGVRLMARSISTAFGQFGREMQTKAFSGIFHNLLIEGNQFINTVLPAFAGFIQELARVGAEKGAVSGLANILGGIGHGLTAVVTALGPFVGTLSQTLSGLGGMLAPIGKVWGSLIGALSSALGPLIQSLLPGFTSVMNVLASALTQLAPLLGELAGSVGQALGPVLQQAAQAAAPLVTALVQGLAPILTSLVPVIRDMAQIWAQDNGVMLSMMRIVEPFIPLLGTLLGGLQDLTSPLLRLAVIINGSTMAALNWVIKGIADIVGAVAGWVTSVIAWGTQWQNWGHLLATVWSGVTTAWDVTTSGIQSVAENLWNYLWGDFGAKIQNFFVNTIPSWWSAFWSATKSIFSGGVAELGTIWHELEGIFSSPVNFLINPVYDQGIRGLWNTVAHAIPGLPTLPYVNPIGSGGGGQGEHEGSAGRGGLAGGGIVPGLAGGGITPGTDHGKDAYLMPMRPKEGVLTPPTVDGLGGPGAVYALNNHFDPSSNRAPGGIGHTLDKLIGRQIRKHTVERGAEHLVGLAGGGIVGDVLGGISSLGSMASSVGRIVAALATGNTEAFANAASQYVHTPAKGDLGKMMTGIPHQIIKQLAGYLSTAGMAVSGGSAGALPGGGSNSVGDLPANWKTIASFLSTHGFTKFAAAGVAGNIQAESGGQPEILEEGGGGGGGLIQWTPYPPGYITGDYQRDLMTQLYAILSWGGGPSIVNRATSPSNAALLYQDYYERPASLTASLPIREASANAVYQAMGWGKFDGGGYLMPGQGGYSNASGPEAVLNPTDSQTFAEFVQLFREFMSARGGGSSAPSVVQNFNGVRVSPEDRAEMARQLTLALSGPA
jgi:hypothetical protein